MSSSHALDGVVILVVDDNADWRDLLGEVLTSHGAQVVTAESGIEAIRILEKAPPDVLLSDIGMSEMDGFEFLRRVRKLPGDRGGNVPAIALTGFSRSEDRTRAGQTVQPLNRFPAPARFPRRANPGFRGREPIRFRTFPTICSGIRREPSCKGSTPT